MKYFYYIFTIFVLYPMEGFSKNSASYFLYNIKKDPDANGNNVYRVNQKSMYRFSKKARKMRLPASKKFNSGRGRSVYDRHKVLFTGMGYKIRTDTMDISLHEVKSSAPPSSTVSKHAYWGKARVDAFNDLNNGDYHEAYPVFWSLATQAGKEISNKQRQRDALFAGISAQKAGLENVALMSYLYAIRYGLGRDKVSPNSKEDKGNLRELLRFVSKFKDPSRVDMLVRKIDSRTIVSVPKGPDIDPIFFSLVKQRFHDNEEISSLLSKKISSRGLTQEKMKLFQALLYADKGETKRAFSILKGLLESSTNPKTVEQARINLARLFAQSSQYQEAIDMYRTLPVESLNHLDVLLEIAWLEFKSGNYGASLGKSIGMRTSFFRHAFLPELYILEAYNRKKICDFGGALKAVKNLQKDYIGEIRAIRALAMKKRRNLDFSMYAALQDSLLENGDAVQRYERYLFQLPIIVSWQTFLYEIEKEYIGLRDEFKNTKSANKKNIVIALGDFYQKAKENASIQIESAIYNALKEMDRKILALFRETQYLDVDVVISAELNHSVHLAKNYPELPEAEKQKLLSSQNLWPMEDDEVWEDEIAWMQVRNQSKCISKKQHVRNNAKSKKKPRATASDL